MGRMNGGSEVLVVVLATMILANIVKAQIYTCWGGCYNECFLRSNETGPQRLACYFQCLNSCVPRSVADYRYYCQIGCSLGRCSPRRYTDGARNENCFGRCSNLCGT